MTNKDTTKHPAKKFVDHYRDKFPDRNVKEPFREAQLALGRGEFSTRERTEFFNVAFADIICELFESWLKTEPHATKEREYLYHCAMSLGSVNEMLRRYETFGKNQGVMLAQQKAQEASNKKDTNEQS